ncbi:MAG: hypothetical protein R3F19_08325 [Verrucomicrobiales bacterium]
MNSGLTVAIATVVAIALGVHFYAKLLSTLRWRHRILWETLGKPTLLMVSLDRTFRLQSFIFSRKALQTGDKEISSTVVIIRVFTFAFVLAVVVAGIALGWKIVG